MINCNWKDGHTNGNYDIIKLQSSTKGRTYGQDQESRRVSIQIQKFQDSFSDRLARPICSDSY